MKLAMYKRWLGASAGLAVIATLSATAFAQAPVAASMQTRTPVRFAQTAPLRSLPWQMPSILQRIVGSHKISRWQKQALLKKLEKAGYLHPNKRRSLPVHRKEYFWSKAHHVKDPVRQTRQRNLHQNGFTNLVANFDTISNQWSIFPPDPNAAVGENYVTMIVNLGFAVYDKSGNLVMGPVDTNTLWAPLGGECASDNNGDPIVLYDQIGHHWLITQFALSGPYDQCIAVSATGDPTGSWYLYDYLISNDSLNDYPKFGVWPDAFYATWNLLDVSKVGFGAFDRHAMEAGDPNAQMILFKVDESQSLVYSDLPASMDGMNPPPPGAPGLFINYVSPNLWGISYYALELWQMHVDWSNPDNSTFTGPTEIDVAPFNDLCGPGLGDCIPQPSPGPLLESLSDRLMYRFAYRNLGDHQALVLMHNVSVGAQGEAPVGERWYELDAPAGSTDPADWTVVQQSTFGPDDGLSRWMGSIAMDHVGNIAMGYSTSSSSQYPSIVYTGRLASDPAGEMTEPETMIQAGGGAQTRPLARWGDYSSMVTDPTDDCTFWYANEYMPTTSYQGWRGHIAAFKFPNCSEGPQGTLTGTVTNAVSGKAVIHATVDVTPGDISVTTDDKGAYTIQLATGDYQATASGFGYSSQTIAVTIEANETTTQNFALSPAPSAVLMGGRIKDQGHGYPLYAEVSVALNGSTVARTWTSPYGTYKLPLLSGNSYTVTVTPYLTGYTPGTATVALNGNTRRDFTLGPDSSCSAPGYGYPFGEDFDGGSFPPEGWTAIHTPEDSVQWLLSSQEPIDSGNYTDGTGNAADADSNDYGSVSGSYDTSLISAPIQVADVGTSPVLNFLENFNSYSGNEAFDVDVSTDGGNTWTTVEHQTQSCGSHYGLPGCPESLDLSSYLDGATSFQLRFRYYNPSSDYDWYVQIDNLSIGSCAPIPGGLVIGTVTDASTGEPLIGVTLTDESGRTTETASAGNQTGFAIFEPAGVHTLTASFAGYQDESRHGTVSDGQKRQVHYNLTATAPAAGPKKQ